MKRRVTEKNISPHRKNRLKFTALILAVTAFVLTSVVVAYAEEKINVKVDYVAKLNELAKADRPENLNAAAYYNKAFELVVERPQQLKKNNRKIWPTDLSTKQLKILQTWVQQNAQALKHLKKGTQKPHHWHKYHGNSMPGIVLPQLRQAKTLAIALCSRAKLEAVKGDYKDAFSDLLACYRFGTHFTGPKHLIEQLVGVAIRALAVDAAFQILDKQRPPSHLLKNFQQTLQEFSSQEKFAFDFTAEKLRTYDGIQMIFTDDGTDGGYLPKAEIANLISGSRLSENLSATELQELRRKFEKLERQETTELADRIYEYFSRIAHKTPWQWRNEDIQKVVEEMPKENPFLHTFIPATGRVVEISFRCKAGTEALIATIAILRYKADKGRWPENLEKPVLGGYLEKLPMDPYSGKPLVYKRTKVKFLLYSKDDFLLYSFGADFDDDGGVASKWGEGEKGGDQVFWPVRPPEKQKDKPNAK